MIEPSDDPLRAPKAGSGADRYRLVKDHFMACVELSPEERTRYLAGPQLADPALREEVTALLKEHEEHPVEPPATAVAARNPGTGSTVSASRNRRSAVLLILLAGAAATLLILGLRAWVLEGLERRLRIDGLSRLSATVESRAARVRAWAERQKQLGREVVADPQLAVHAAALNAAWDSSGGDPKAILALPAYRSAFERLSRCPTEITDRGFILISPDGRDLCAETESLVGHQVNPSGAAYLRRCILGEWMLSRPYGDRQFATGMSPDLAKPVMFVGGPVADRSGKIVAAAIFRFSPDREFFGLLAPSGATRVLAFDATGLLMNELGTSADLRRLGLIRDVGESRTALQLILRDPGEDLEGGFRPTSSPERWSRTQLALSAAAGESGGDGVGYRDHLGRMVLGAWTWLTEWEMGIGAEEEVGLLLAPMRPVGLTLAAFAGVPPLVTVALLLWTGAIPLRRRSGRSGRAGPYVLERPLGKGGMAEVFLARHEVLKRPAAVKILGQARLDPVNVARFQREARLAGRLAHPNAVQIFDYGEMGGGDFYFAMEYVEGITFAQLILLETRISAARAVHLLRQAAGALEEAHFLGLLHRDLKPSNLMVCSRGGMGDVVKVLDFGIACSTSGLTEDHTRSGELLGTPGYLAPERIRAPQESDPRSDIYSFGAVAFHLLTGRSVFEGSAPAELVYQIMAAKRPSPSQLRGETLPARLEELVTRCLAVDPAARPQTFADVLAALDDAELTKGWSQNQARAWWAANRERALNLAAAGA